MAAEVQALCDAVTVVISPVMRIAYDGVLPEMSGEEVLIFTSRHGVEGFCRLSARRDFTCYAVGDATAEAAEAQGMRAISAGGDAEALLARIAAEGVHGPFVHLRGAHVAADIAGALRAAGITTPLFVAAISRNVADTVPEGVARRVDIAETPDLPGMLALVQHQVQMAKRLEGGKRPQ